MAIPYPKIKRKLSPNYSSRLGRSIKGSVVHTTESDDGPPWAVADYFAKKGVEASSHYVIGTNPIGPDRRFTEVVQVVPESYKAWTQLSANPYVVSYELVGRAHERTKADWLGQYRAQLHTLAAMVAQDSLQYDFPVQHSFPGVLGHVDLAKYGFPQTHTDPGPGFPWGVFVGLVRHYQATRRKPVVQEVPAKLKGRPKGAPLRIPSWAWELREWWYAGRKGPRPKDAPKDLPDWFWPWFKWKMGDDPH